MCNKKVYRVIVKVQHYFSNNLNVDVFLNNLNLEENFVVTLSNDKTKVHFSYGNLHYFIRSVSELGCFDIERDDLNCINNLCVKID